MNSDQLLANFDRISEAPDAVPRLRRFILDLAVRGKLVDQDPNDEPALELLKKLKHEKERLVKAGSIRNPKILENSAEDGALYTVPIKWTWCRLSDVGAIVGGGTPPSGDLDNFTAGGTGVAWLTPADLGKTVGSYVSHGSRDLTPAGLRSSSATLMPKGSVLFSSRAPIGYTAIAANDVTTNQGFKSVVPFIPACNLYIAVYFRAFGPWIESKASGTTFREVSGKIVANLPFPLPPLVEQDRIVAKVDELMALCDQLEAAQGERERRRDTLTAASLNRLNKPDAEIDTFRTRAHFHLQQMPVLTARSDQLQKLREIILSLAVRGKLVPQDPNDEPASELLLRIQKDKECLVKEGIIKSEKPIKNGHGDSKPFDLPKGWMWVRLEELTELITKGSSPKWQGIEYTTKQDGILFVTSENVGNYKLRKMDNPKYVERKFNAIEPRSILRSGDILMNLVGASIGRTAVYDLHDVANINQAVALIRLVNSPHKAHLDFLLHYFNNPSAVNFMLASRVVTAQPNMSLTDAREFPVPLPPLAEQHRIVAKVDKLMALCDQVEAQLAISQNVGQQFLEAVLHQALAAA